MNPIVGSIVALVTPMHEDGRIDYDGLRRLIDWHIAEGTDCIGVVGTTGESPTVSMEENCEVIRVAVEQASPFGWDRWTGSSGAKVCMNGYGASAPLPELQKRFGFTVENIVVQAKAQLALATA